MTLKTLRRLLGVAFVVWVMASAAPSYAQTGGIQGFAKDEQGNRLAGYPIIIERQDVKGIYKTKTNKKGTYVYIGLPLGQYKITLQDPQGHQIFYITRHIGMGDPTEVDFDMAKEKAQAAKDSAANPQVQAQLQTQQKEQKQFTGLKQLFDQGNQLMAAGKYEDAAASFEKALPLAKGKNQVVLESQAAMAYTKAKQYDKALSYYQKAIADDPTDANLHNQLGNMYVDENKIPEAKAEFEKAAQLDPTNAAKAYYNIGAIMTNTGHMDEAAAAFKHATQIDPNYGDAYFLEAQSLMGKATMGANGKVIPAPGTVEALQDYLKVDPNGKYAAAAQQMLQNITGEVQTQYKKTKKK